ncbi:MAG: SRPBCC family protein [Gemmataceae bacterium]
MPLFQSAATIACPPPLLFDFLARPANMLRLTPPDVKFDIVQAPERLELGSVIIIKGRRYGGIQRLISAVTKFEPNTLIVDEQRHGPFRRFVRTQKLDPDGEHVRLTDRIEFDPPSGVLGLLLTADRIGRDLARLNEFRTQMLKQLLEPRPVT